MFARRLLTESAILIGYVGIIYGYLILADRGVVLFFLPLLAWLALPFLLAFSLKRHAASKLVFFECLLVALVGNVVVSILVATGLGVPSSEFLKGAIGSTLLQTLIADLLLLALASRRKSPRKNAEGR